jgi:hypothetical protein
MMNDPQAIFNIVLTIAAAAGGWILNLVNTNIKDLRDSDVRLSEDISDIKEHYARRADVREWTQDIREVLVRIEQKLDKKVDK